MLGLVLAASGLGAWWLLQTPETGSRQPITSGRTGFTRVTLLNSTGQLTAGRNEFYVQFEHAVTNEPLDVSNVRVQFFMPAMGTMPPMQSGADVTPTDESGLFHATADIQMAGNWEATVQFEGPEGPQRVKMNITAMQ